MNASDLTISLQAAISNYFAGERREGVLIIAGASLAVAFAVWLWVATRSSFAVTFGATVLLSGVLLAATAGSLLVRDKQLAASVLQGIASTDRTAVTAAEHERVGIILSKYRYYRNGATALAALGILGLLLSDRAWVHGISAGLLLLVVAQILIDHYSERRARIYHEHLSAMQVSPPT
jgi:hypothetical protein